MLDDAVELSTIVEYLDQYVIGPDDAKRIVSIYSHFRKIARSDRAHTRITESNRLQTLMPLTSTV
jgi:ATP-dependent protease Clp ATPase subunit